MRFFICFLFICVSLVGARQKGKSRNYRAPLLKKEPQCDLTIQCKKKGKMLFETNNVGFSVPLRGPRGPPGPPGPSTGGSTQVNRVAFFAGLTDNMGPLKRDEVVKFDEVITNFGQSYDSSTGIFRAPLNGVYSFQATIAPIGGNKASVTVVRRKLGMEMARIMTIWAESLPFWSSSSQNWVLQLEQGEETWLELNARASYLHGYMYSTFSGYLIFDVPNDKNVVIKTDVKPYQ